jgi:nucleoside-diphosphate-sugar epimerase
MGDVVLLGHTGFVGHALQDHLANKGARVHGFSSSTLDLRQPQAFAVLDDALIPDATLIVASALTPDRGGATLDALVDSVAMTVNVARYMETHPPALCVYVGSDAVYPMIDEDVTEATPADPTNFYALAKYNGERVLQLIAEARNIPLLVVRPTGVFGPRDPHNSYGPNRFVRSIAETRSVKLFGKGEETRDHLYLDDLVRAISDLIDAKQTGVFTIATGTSRSFRSIVELLSTLVPFEFEIVEAPRSGPITHRSYDTSRFQAALPDFQFTPFDAALAATVRSTLVVR